MKLILPILAIWLLAVFSTSSVIAQESGVPFYQASPSSQLDRTISCNDLRISGQTSGIPAQVTYEVDAVDEGREMEGFRYHLGDGLVREFGADGGRYVHDYNQPGSYLVWVEVRGRNDRWFSSPACMERVEVTADTTQARVSACVGIDLNDVPVEFGQQEIGAGEVVKLSVKALDTQEAVELYRLDFGDGISDEQVGNVFLHEYDRDGVYRVRAEFLPGGQEAWVRGESACEFELVIGEGESGQVTGDSVDVSGAYGVESGVSRSSQVVGLVLAGGMLVVGVGVMVWMVRRVRS